MANKRKNRRKRILKEMRESREDQSTFNTYGATQPHKIKSKAKRYWKVRNSIKQGQ